MKTDASIGALFWHVLMLCLLLVFLCGGAFAATPAILDFQGGVIVWTNVYPDGLVTLQWSADLTGPWSEDWDVFDRQPAYGAVMQSPVPRFFRIANDPAGVDWVVISNAHNAADSTGYGAVNYTFLISKYEVSNGQYAEFLNAVDPIGANTNTLYSSLMGTDPRGGITYDSTQVDGKHYIVKEFMWSKPVIHVSFWDAARFVNWLHNGQGLGSMEVGAYDFLGIANPANSTISRCPGARYFLPNEDEWYKAAYYDPSVSAYRLYPTKSDSAPTIAHCNARGGITNDSASIANYNNGADWNGQDGNLTSIGSGGSGSESPYGAADMAGNAAEWVETIIDSSQRGVRGGGWHNVAVYLQSPTRIGHEPAYEFDTVGFRIARPQ